MGIKIRERAADGVTILDLEGRLTLETFGVLKDTVRGLVDTGCRRVVLRLAGVSYVDSIGVAERRIRSRREFQLRMGLTLLRADVAAGHRIEVMMASAIVCFTEASCVTAWSQLWDQSASVGECTEGASYYTAMEREEAEPWPGGSGGRRCAFES